MNNTFKNEIMIKSNNFWNVLFLLLDQMKEVPLTYRNAAFVELTLDENYILKVSDQSCWIVERSDPQNRCAVSLHKEDLFPYTRLLNWYLNKSVVKKHYEEDE